MDNANNTDYESIEHEKITQARVKKGLVFIVIISITMMFLGLSSAYMVSAGDSFWVKFPMPSFFWASTVAIILSSIAFEVAILLMKKGKSKIAKIFVVITTLLGVFFAYSQFKGYGQMVDNGAYFVNQIVVSNGRYGDYFEIKKNQDLIEVNGNSFFIKGAQIASNEKEELQLFAEQFLAYESNENLNLVQYNVPYSLIYRFEPLYFANGKLFREDSTELQQADWNRLQELMTHIAAGRGDFFVKGEYGKDFSLYYGGEELQYEKRQLFINNKELPRGLQLKLYDSKDNATSYLYIITFLHLLHILVTLLYMFAFTRRTFAKEFSSSNTLVMRVTAIFWHFLGILWISLLLFLIFVH
jgi:cytochrome c oxidase subunit 3